jgi:hypothetical protein
MNPYELWVSRPELMRLSGFTLPMASIPADQRARLGPVAVRDRLTVQPRSTDQIRTLERHGLLDLFIPKQRTRTAPVGQAIIIWRRPARRRGDSALYSLLDVATARLVGWMLRDGLSYSVVRDALRGAASARATLWWALEHLPGAMLMVSERAALVLGPDQLRELDAAAPSVPLKPRKLFPLAWLGLERDVLPRIQKMRTDKPDVIRWRQEWPAAVLQKERAAAERIM